MITVTAMASPVSASAYLGSSCTVARQAVYSVVSSSPRCSSSSGTISCPRNSKTTFNLRRFSSWSGLKNLSISRNAKSARTERKKRRTGMVVYASLFGVGAPEALVIGVVALLVFGPKGLAEVARNLGKTLRAFQPTIREIQEVSREFKSTLEREIGLDEVPDQSTSNVNPTTPTSFPPTITRDQEPQAAVDPNGDPSSDQTYSSEELLKITEEQLNATAYSQQSQQQGETAVSVETSTKSPSKPQVDENDTTPRPVKSETGT